MYKIKSDELRLFIKNKGFTIKAISKSMGLQPTSLSRKIANNRKFTINDLIMICKIVNIDICDFIKNFLIKEINVEAEIIKKGDD
ncbi:MAG: helix-turn-helix transcriptional regulator [Gammaproteobacteria bacterium]|jgi:transcriptional regulator with XRE-family HTH domain